MSATMHRAETWDRVSHREHCPICDKPDYCKTSPDKAIAGCMRIAEGSFKTKETDLGPMYLHRLTDEPRATPPPRPQPAAAPQRNVLADRAVYALVVATCAPLPAYAADELERRFGTHWRAIAAARHIGYCDGPALLATIAAAGRRGDAIAAGVLNRDGTVARSLLGRLVIPYLRDGLVHDLRGAGIKGRDETKEISLRGAYADRGVADLCYNDDALRDCGPDGVLHLAGGAYKTMALLAAGLNAAGLRGEAELSDGHSARLHAAGVRTIILHIDAEDPKEGQPHSAGRRLGLAKAERLAAAGFTVLMAEPPREPGTPKVDPDALLRDLGPRAVRDYALSAIPLEAWRVVIGVAPAAVSEEAATEIATWKQRCAKQQRTLSNVLHIRNNRNMKAERDTLTASVLHMAAAQEAGHHTPSGRIRQPLYKIAESVGKKNPAVSKHLKLGAQEGLFRRELLEEVLVREVDEETGQSRNILRLKDADGRVVEECPAEPVLGAALAYRHATGEEATGAYYVTPLHEPTEILDILVTLKPDRGDKKDWGGKREPCPRCGSTKTRTVTYCGDCDLILKETEHDGDQGNELPTDEAGNVPPIAVEDLAATPPAPHAPRANVREEEDDEADTWDPNFCNHPGCAARLDPALHTRYCWQHRQVGLAPEAPPVRLPVGGAPALDREIVEDTARKWSLAAIDERLERYRERWAAGEDTAQLRLLLTDWRAIRVARVAHEAARTVPAGAD